MFNMGQQSLIPKGCFHLRSVNFLLVIIFGHVYRPFVDTLLV